MTVRLTILKMCEVVGLPSMPNPANGNFRRWGPHSGLVCLSGALASLGCPTKIWISWGSGDLFVLALSMLELDNIEPLHLQLAALLLIQNFRTCSVQSAGETVQIAPA